VAWKNRVRRPCLRRGRQERRRKAAPYIKGPTRRLDGGSPRETIEARACRYSRDCGPMFTERFGVWHRGGEEPGRVFPMTDSFADLWMFEHWNLQSEFPAGHARCPAPGERRNPGFSLQTTSKNFHCLSPGLALRGNKANSPFIDNYSRCRDGSAARGLVGRRAAAGPLAPAWEAASPCWPQPPAKSCEVEASARSECGPGSFSGPLPV